MKKFFTTEKIAAMAAKLRGKPIVENNKREHTAQETVRLLSKEIALLEKRGYTLNQILEMLREEGLSLSMNTFKNYLQTAKKKPEQVPANTPLPVVKKTLKNPPPDVKKLVSESGFNVKPDTQDI